MAHHHPHPDLPDPLPVASVGDGRSVDRAPFDDDAPHEYHLPPGRYLRPVDYYQAVVDHLYDARTSLNRAIDHGLALIDEHPDNAALYRGELDLELDATIDDCRRAHQLVDNWTPVIDVDTAGADGVDYTSGGPPGGARITSKSVYR